MIIIIIIILTNNRPGSSITTGSIMGGGYVEMLISIGNMTITSVEYEQISSPFMNHNCLSFTIISLIGNDTFGILRCQLEGGHSKGYRFIINYCGMCVCFSYVIII
jgi:hypothetical protein